MTTEDYFRFLAIRPPQKITEQSAKLSAARFHPMDKSPMHKAISEYAPPAPVAGAASPVSPRDNAEKAALDLFKSARYQGGLLTDVVFAAKKALDSKTVSEARNGVRLIIADINDKMSSANPDSLYTRSWDSYYAQIVLPSFHPEDRSDIETNLRAFALLKWLDSAPAEIALPSTTDVRRLRILVPADLFPPPDNGQFLREKRAARDEALNAAADDLEQVALLERTISQIDQNRFAWEQLQITRSLKSLPAPAAADGLQPLEMVYVTGPMVRTSLGLGGPAGKTFSTSVALMSSPSDWIFGEFSEKNLDENVFKYLKGRQKEFSRSTPEEIMQVLTGEVYDLIVQLSKQPMALSRVGFGKAGDAAINYSIFLKALNRLCLPFTGNLSQPGSDHPTPDERGIKPLGIGDLHVVRQFLQSYQLGELAHVENVLQSEKRMRATNRLQEIEQTVTVETENVQESEKDLQTTERFELHQEAEKTVKEASNFDAGVSVTASYGPVSISAHADYATNSSKEESQRSASTYAKDITERSVQKILQRTREERTTRTLERFEERNEHGFDNSGGTGNVTGVYRWIDKYYRAQVVNYGRRLMMEFILPEPGAFYGYCFSKKPVQGVTAKKPNEPLILGRRLQPSDLNAFNYSAFVAEYNVAEISAYPEQAITINGALAKTVGDGTGNKSFADSQSVTIPDDYEAYFWYGTYSFSGFEGQNHQVLVGGNDWGTQYLSGIKGTAMISTNGWSAAYDINIGFQCRPTRAKIEKWQLETFNKIMGAYQQAMDTYQQQLDSAAVSGGVQIQGQNPEANRRTERDELKRGALRQLTKEFAAIQVAGTWRYNAPFDAMADNQPPYSYPEFDVDESIIEGKVIQFFEQAFEWDNVTYRFYSYMWGRKSKWADAILESDTDPLFAEFLRAGAARIVVPVRPAYADAVCYFMNTNIIWNGGDVPTINDPLYVAIATELKEDSSGDLPEDLKYCAIDGTLPCLVEEWTVKLPTTLVYLQKDGSLPTFNLPGNQGGAGVQVPTDLAAKLDQLAKASGENPDWRTSIVDLLKLLGRDSSLVVRKQLATRHNCPAEIMADTASMNMWLHALVLDTLKKNNGQLPGDF